MIDTYLHPAYLRLIEGVLYPFLVIAAKQSRFERGVSTDGLNLFNVVDELRDRGFRKACSAYEHGMRNGIAHGSILYGDQSITYTDARNNSTSIDVYSVIEKCDLAVDVCNALAAAIKVFLLRYIQDPSMFPRAMMVEDFQAVVQAPWWQIESCLPSTIANKSQLNIYAKADTLDYDKVFYSCIESSVLAEHYMPGFQRYFIKIESDRAMPGWAAFDGNILKDARINNSTITEVVAALEEGLVFYVPKFSIPKPLRRLNTLRFAVKAQFDKNRIEKSGAGTESSFVIRIVKAHIKPNTLFGLSIEARVILKELDPERIRGDISRIYRQTVHEAKRSDIQNKLTGVGFVKIFMYDKDMRKRKFESYGLGLSLVGTVQVRVNHNIRDVDIVSGHVEQFGRFRIVWNRRWNKYSSLKAR